MDEAGGSADGEPYDADQDGAEERADGAPALTVDGREALRREVEEALLSELDRVGPEALNRARVLRRFEGRGACRASLFRWARDLFASGRAAAHIEHLVKRAGEERASRNEDPAIDAGQAALAAVLPRAVSPDDVVGLSAGIDAIGHVRRCIQTALDVAEHARGPDGRVRNPRLLLQATDSLRRCLETATRLQQALRDLQSVEAFHQGIIEEIAKESPEVVERIIRRLGHLCALHTGAG
jgi:hypothetical protein